MKQISIRQVQNGYIIFDTPEKRFAGTSGEYVFKDLGSLGEHLVCVFESRPLPAVVEGANHG